MKKGITTCPNCMMRVLPKQDGTCPSCQAVILSKQTSPKQKAHRGQLQGKEQTKPATVQGTKDVHTPGRSKRGKVLIRPRGKAFQVTRETLGRTLGLMDPKYDELSAFLTGLTCLVLYLSYPNLRQLLHQLVNPENTVTIGGMVSLLFWGLIVISGFSLSFFHVVTIRRKSSIEKYCMGAFAIGANAFASIMGCIEALNSGKLVFILFPILNILTAFIMFYRVREGKFEFTDENASLPQVILASAILLLVFAIAFLGIRATWPVTFSICMLYSTTLIFLITWTIGRFKLLSFTRRRY